MFWVILAPHPSDRDSYLRTVRTVIKETRQKLFISVISCLAGLVVGTTVFTPVEYQEGNSIKIGENLHALVVTTWYGTPLTSYATDLVTDLGIDRVNFASQSIELTEAAMDASASADRLLGKNPTPALLLQVFEESSGWEAGLRNGDVVVALKKDRVCGAKRASDRDMRVLWDRISNCGGVAYIKRDGNSLNFKINSSVVRGVKAHEVGTGVVPAIPNRLRGVEGRSAGLALALMYLDERTEGSLLGNQVVAATGTITSFDDHVGFVGGLEYKIPAGRDAGANLILIPLSQGDEFGPMKGVSIVEVGSLSEAVRVLCDRGSDDELCRVMKA